jgi:glycosyltransferase involved in cell wall biosynthesis
MTRVWGTLDPFFELGPIVGRRVANSRFLHALLRRDPFDEYHFFLAQESDIVLQKKHMTDFYPALAEAGKFHYHLRLHIAERLREIDFHCIHLSDCINFPAAVAQLRNRFSRRIFPVTGTTHSLSYADYPRKFLLHLWAGTTPRDCVLTTSSCADEVVRQFYAGLRDGYGIDEATYPAPVTRRIPLGVDLDVLTPPSPQERARLRARFEISPDQTAILAFGRLHHHSKYDLLPVFRAVQRLIVGGMDRSRIRLVFAGWVEDKDEFPEMASALAANLGVSLSIHARPSNKVKREIFGACDIFVSPSDNPQETFGLTILEAQAMGLPVVCSDYDGYKDLVVDGETGLLVPTIGARDTTEATALTPLLFANQAHLFVAQSTVVDVPAMAEALERLIEDPALRRRMGVAGRARMEASYSWDTVIERHVELWDELWDAAVDEERVRGVGHPLNIDYARIFGCYPSEILDDGLRLVRSTVGQAFYRGMEGLTVYAGIGAWIDEELVRKAGFFARKPSTVGELRRRLAEAEPSLSAERIDFVLLWSLKHDLLERA